MEPILAFVLYTSLFINVLLLGIVAIRLWKGKHVIDRLMASDILTNLALAVLVLGAMIHHQNIFLDVALGLAALGFISVIAFARYITHKRVF